MDTAPEARFDAIVCEVAEHFAAPIVLISFVDEDRQWFKSRLGFDYTETERIGGFCSHTIAIDAPLVVENAHNHPLFADSLYVKAPPHIAFYAGVPVRASGGEAIGALCILDTKPRSFEIVELRELISLARRIETELEARQGEFQRR